MTSVSGNSKYRIDRRQSSAYKEKTVLNEKSYQATMTSLSGNNKYKIDHRLPSNCKENVVLSNKSYQANMTSISSNNKYKIDRRQPSGSKEKTVLSDKSLPSIPCPCHRPLSLIMCKVCGVTFTGRLRLLCCSHPNTRYI